MVFSVETNNLYICIFISFLLPSKLPLILMTIDNLDYLIENAGHCTDVTQYLACSNDFILSIDSQREVVNNILKNLHNTVVHNNLCIHGDCFTVIDRITRFENNFLYRILFDF